jgi:hypothetical protein
MPLTVEQIAANNIETLLARVTFNIDPSLVSGLDAPSTIKDGRDPSNFETLEKYYYHIKSKLADPNDQPKLERYTLVSGVNGLGVLESKYEKNKYNLIPLLREHLNELARYEKGRQLLSKVASLAFDSNGTDSPFRIRISNYKENRYKAATNVLTLNPWDTIATTCDTTGALRLFSIKPTIHGTATVLGVREDLAVSVNGLSPYFLTIAHELIHFKDVKESEYYKIDPIPDYNRPIYNRIARIINPRVLSEENIYYEHRAVFDGDPDDVSELSIRMEAGEPLRYLYQYPGGMLYEPVSSVLKYASALTSVGNRSGLLGEMYNYLYRFPKNLPIMYVDTQHTKVRLASLPIFMHYYRDSFNENPASATEFVRRRTSPARIQKVVNSIDSLPSFSEKRTRRNKELNILQNMGLVSFLTNKSTGAAINPAKMQEAFEMLLGLEKASRAVLNP